MCRAGDCVIDEAPEKLTPRQTFTHRQCIGDCPWDQHLWRVQEVRLSKGETESRYSCNRSLSQFHTEFWSLEGPQSCTKLWNGGPDHYTQHRPVVELRLTQKMMCP